MFHWGGISLTRPTENAEAIPIGGYFLIQLGSTRAQLFKNFKDAAE